MASSAFAPSRAPGARRAMAWRCRFLGALFIAAAFAFNLFFLLHDCPIDLAEDEAYYWEWSRHLDLSYYSKGPLVAYLIRASCSLLGETAVAVRLPALIFCAATACLTYYLTLRLFGSDRMALGAMILSYLAPMSVSRGLVMTIDAPLFFCWGLATCAAYSAVTDRRAWLFPVAGAALGLGLMAKLSMAFWLVGFLLWLAVDRVARARVRAVHIFLLSLTGVLFALPMVIWNLQHDWVTLRHVNENIGLSATGSLALSHILDFVGGQLGVIGPVLFPLIVLAIAGSFRRGVGDDRRAGINFLLCFGLSFLGIVFLGSLRTNPGANWPLPAYFTLMILLAHHAGQRLDSRSRAWFAAFIAAIAINLALVFLAYGSELLYRPYLALCSRFDALPKLAIKVDPTARVRGWAELGQAASAHLRAMPSGAFLLADRYQFAAELAFYVDGQPKVYCAGAYFSDPTINRGLCQYDLWADRDLSRVELRDRDAIYFGEPNDDIRSAFESVEALKPLVIARHGLAVRVFQLYRCRGFKGMIRPGNIVRYWSR